MLERSTGVNPHTALTQSALTRLRRTLPQVLLVLICLSTIGCDHVSKDAASSFLGLPANTHGVPAKSRGALPLIQGVFELRYTENRGVAFGWLNDIDHAALPWLLGLGALAGTAAVATHWWRRRRASFVEQASYATISAGGAANALDRLQDGSVVDFLHVTGWPIFNVADVAIVVGAILFALAYGGAGTSGPRLLRPPDSG